MPRYSFECHHCVTRFERTLKMGDHPTHACPSCKEEAPRLFDGSGFGFGFKGGGTSDANSGVHGHDYPTADMAIGRSSEERWATYVERDRLKKKVRQQGGSGVIQRIDGDGYSDYTALLPNERQARDKLIDYAVDVSQRPEVKPGQ